MNNITETSSANTASSLTMNDTIIQKIRDHDIVSICYLVDRSKRYERSFAKTKQDFYDGYAGEVELSCCVTNKVVVIPITNIRQIGYPSSEEQSTYLSNKLTILTNEYQKLSATCSSEYNLDDCFFDSNLTDHRLAPTLVLLDIPTITEYETPSEQTLIRARQKLIKLIQTKIAQEKENIKREFESLSAEENADTAAEIASITEFLDSIENESTSMLEQMSSIKDMIDAWPPVLGTLVSQ
jgi:hypothetical protein